MDRRLTNPPTGAQADRGWPVELQAAYASSAEVLIRLAAVLLGRRSEAEEVVHDAFIAVSVRVEAIDNLDAYLRRTVINGAYGVLRRRQVAERHDTSLGLDPPPAEAPMHLIEFRDVLMTLSWNQRTVIVLRFLEGLSVRETARILDCRESTVRSHSRRGLKRLRKDLSS